MINEAQVSLSGYVATQPRWRETRTGTAYVTMRVAWTPRRLDRSTGEWADGHTSYVTVICWRKLAHNIATCLRKGDPVVVQGRLSVRPYDDKEGVHRVAVEVAANCVGHDLSRGVAEFQRTRPQTGKTAAEHAAEQEAGTGFDSGDYADPARVPDGELAAAMTAADGAGPLSGPSGPAGPQMFDEGAIDTLAGEAEQVSVPF